MSSIVKSLSMALIFVMVSCASLAEKIDFTTMTGAELQELRDSIDAEIASNHYVGSGDRFDIENDLENFFVETYGVKSYAVNFMSMDVMNDWGVYSVTCSYSFNDENYERHTGDIVAEYRMVDYDLERVYLEVDGDAVVDKRDASEDIKEQEAGTNAIDSIQFGELLDATINEIDNVIVIKAKIGPSFSNKATVDQNYYNTEYLIRNFCVDQYSELQYWAVADMTDGSEAKVISFDVPQSVMLKLKNNEIAANKLGSYVDNLWIHQSLK